MDMLLGSEVQNELPQWEFCFPTGRHCKATLPQEPLQIPLETWQAHSRTPDAEHSSCYSRSFWRLTNAIHTISNIKLESFYVSSHRPHFDLQMPLGLSWGTCLLFWVGWLTISVCLELRDFSGHWTSSAKNKQVPGKLGVLVTLVLGEGARLTHGTLKIF